MLRFSGVINDYNYSLPIRIVRHGGPRVSSYLQPILFVRRRGRVDKYNDSENKIVHYNIIYYNIFDFGSAGRLHCQI